MIAYEPPGCETLSWVASHSGAPVVHVERLVGGITADVDRLDFGGGRPAAVLRRWTDTSSWTDGSVEREVAGLLTLENGGLPVPRVMAADPTGEAAGVRCVLMTALPGEVVLAPPDKEAWLSELARVHARIHLTGARPAARTDGGCDPDAERSWIADRGLRREALRLAGGAPADDVFVHGDYQHFNVLWLDGAISGVVDWTMVGTGSRGRDVGHCMLNLAVLFAPDAAMTYLRRYEGCAGVAVDPRSVLRALLSWDLDWLEFIPVQVAGRTSLDATTMPTRVVDTIRRTVEQAGRA